MEQEHCTPKSNRFFNQEYSGIRTISHVTATVQTNTSFNIALVNIPYLFKHTFPDSKSYSLVFRFGHKPEKRKKSPKRESWDRRIKNVEKGKTEVQGRAKEERKDKSIQEIDKTDSRISGHLWAFI